MTAFVNHLMIIDPYFHCANVKKKKKKVERPDTAIAAIVNKTLTAEE